MPEIAVIIPAFIRTEQQAIWLVEAIQSVEAQTFTDWEIVVCDDGSPFDITPIKRSFPNVRWLKTTESHGPGAARNLAIAATRAPLILPLDADDRLKPDGLATLYEKRCERAYIYGDLEYVGDKQMVYALEDFTTDRLLKLNGPNPITSLFYRAAWADIGGFDETLDGLEDIEFWLRMAASGVCGIHVRKVTFDYRIHGSSRQAKLTANNNAGLIAVGPKIREKHRLILGRLSMASCDKCPGQGGTGNGVPMNIAKGLTAEAINMKYTGRKLGSFFETGPSGIRYHVQGMGTWFKCDPRDIQYFLSFANATDSYMLEPPPPPPPPPRQPRIIEPMPLPDMPDISKLSIREALSLVAERDDFVDLNVWRAEENASPTPRKTVIDAIEKKMKKVAA